MTPKQLRQHREHLGMTQSELAEALRMTGKWAYKTIMKYELGQTPIPGPAAVAVEYMVRFGALEK